MISYHLVLLILSLALGVVVAQTPGYGPICKALSLEMGRDTVVSDDLSLF